MILISSGSKIESSKQGERRPGERLSECKRVFGVLELRLFVVVAAVAAEHLPPTPASRQSVLSRRALQFFSPRDRFQIMRLTVEACEKTV